MSLTHVPVLLYVLADRALRPGAVVLSCSDATQGTLDALMALAKHPDFSAVAALLPWVMTAAQSDALPEPLWQALQQKGCQRLDDASLMRSDALVKPELPPSALWLDGDWFLAPPVKPSGARSSSRTLALKLVQLVISDADIRDIEDVFRQDPALSYHLLRLVNSVGMGSNRQISSFSQAILILGRQQLRRWLNLMLFSANSDDYRSAMLLSRVTWRSRTLELLARQAGLDKSNQELAFMAGMFSMLGILFGSSLVELFKPLQLSGTLVAAVLRHEGELGQLLRLIECYECRDVSAVLDLLGYLNLAAVDLNQISLEACHWMLGLLQEKKG